MLVSARILATGAIIGLCSVAGAITTDGDWTDWFTYGGDSTQTTWDETLVVLNSPDLRSQNDEEGPSPGIGGQGYDIEYLVYAFEDADPNNLSGGVFHVGLVTGFPPDGDPLLQFFAGDMFIDFGNSGNYSVAVATSTSATNAETAGGVDSDYFGNNYFNDGTPNWSILDPVTFPGSGPWRVERNPAIENQFVSNVAWGQTGVHYFLEVSVEVDAAIEDLLTNVQGGVGLHWTMECGNDLIDVRDETPLIPVPEPLTAVLLGMGTIGFAFRSRFVA